jgi:MFS transporter, DHA1 family, multidrug resistance protein
MLPSRSVLLAILCAIAALGLLPSVIYVPSIPDMARDLGVPISSIQMTLTVYLVAYGVSQVLLGPLSDRFGRRVILLTGTAICAVSSLICTFAPGIDTLLAGRAMQAVGACVGMAISRAMVRDLYDRDSTARAMAIVGMVISIVPILSPIIGGYVHVLLGWRWNFAIVAIAAAVLMAIIWRWLPETNNNLQNQTTLLTGVTGSIKTLFRSRRFNGYALATAGGSGAAFGFLASIPIVLIDQLGVPPNHYGYFAALPPCGFVFGSYLTSLLVRRFGVDRMIRVGGAILACGGLYMLSVTTTLDPLWIIPGFVLLGVNNGFVMPNASAGCVSVYPHLAGAASGLAGSVQMLGAAAATLAMAAADIHSTLPIGILFVGCSVLIIFGSLLSARG